MQGRTVFFHADFVRLRHGSADFSRFEAEVRSSGLGVTDLDTESAVSTASIHPQAVGWWILAVLTAMVGNMVVGW